MQRIKTSLIAALASMGAIIGYGGGYGKLSVIPTVAHGSITSSKNGGRKIGAGVAHQKRIATKARNKARK